MAPWTGPRHKSWAKNGNLLTFCLVIVGAVWLAFQVYAAIKHDPTLRPPAADTALMTVLGAWVTNKAVESRAAERQTERRVSEVEARADQLEQVAETAHPDVAAEVIKAPPAPAHDVGEVAP